ncbi:FkbM family methyltransferase [Legionella sp. WA2022007384]
MSFVSFAQNFEDIMLWRALKHVQKGFYIDIGAQHPVIDSVSKAFYDKGWRGIHIEPVPEFVELLRHARPDETVLQIALSDHNGLLDFNIIPGTGLSTAIDHIAETHSNELGLPCHKVQVPTLTLQSAMNTLAENDIHWMKIDVEGFEKEVLNGWDPTRLRPWIILIEATVPNSPETNHAQWESLLISADYLFVYADGLNRFYVAKEHPELLDAFTSPPNIFDKWQITENSWLCQELVANYKVKINMLLEQTASELNLAKEYQAQQQNDAYRVQQEKNALVQELNLQKEYRVHQQGFVQNLQNELNKLNQQLGSLSEELITIKEHRREEHIHTQNLQLELNKANQKLVVLSDGLIAEKEFRRKEQAHIQNLQNELNSANQKLDSLNAELIEEKESRRKEHALTQMQQQNQLVQASIKNSSDINLLLHRQGEDFIYHAYLAALNREPDPEGMQYYLSHLSAGRNKTLIIKDLLKSPEGQSKKIRIKGLNKAFRCYKRQNWPMIGAYFRKVYEKQNNKIKQHLLATGTNEVEPELHHLSEHERHVFYQLKKCID